ncbi:permease prefix domain 1-containing protein [Gracilibacillus sp. S3-1-1]|uniref:Permease prefix domain 1-containing protein n=1 Tax=Gracilibacillus pellucidus TaxID=3095368 RepID=A0ACC6M9G4_9BACI|nr:permease prefix domain 1-containing protein [Gracilibacillus sp. S3-1-1]MDX8047589.1 permease prefix domain 1-containing protein [Gracilibacillus sp. S3-1-1]
MKKIKHFVNELFEDMPDSEQKNAVMEEVIQNLEEKVWDLMEQGKEEEDAINKAIVDFGDVEDLKQELGGKQPVKSKRNMTKINLGYSVWGSGLIIALFVFINFYYTPNDIWFVYPTFAILWWPLTMYFRWLRTKETAK